MGKHLTHLVLVLLLAPLLLLLHFTAALRALGGGGGVVVVEHWWRCGGSVDSSRVDVVGWILLWLYTCHCGRPKTKVKV